MRPSDERANVRATSAAESERGASGEKAPGQGQLADVEGGEGRGGRRDMGEGGGRLWGKGEGMVCYGGGER